MDTREAPDTIARREDRAAEVERLLSELRHPNALMRARAIRQLCPCRRPWVGPEEEALLALRRDRETAVRNALKHVLWEEIRDDPHPNAWRLGEEDAPAHAARPARAERRRRPRTRGWRRAQLPAVRGR
jgi:hypothetical protein